MTSQPGINSETKAYPSVRSDCLKACISLRISFTNLRTIMYLTAVPVQDRTRPMLLLMERERSLSVKMENPSTRDILADSPLDCKRTVAGNSNNLTVAEQQKWTTCLVKIAIFRGIGGVPQI